MSETIEIKMNEDRLKLFIVQEFRQLLDSYYELIMTGKLKDLLVPEELNKLITEKIEEIYSHIKWRTETELTGIKDQIEILEENVATLIYHMQTLKNE